MIRQFLLIGACAALLGAGYEVMKGLTAYRPQRQETSVPKYLPPKTEETDKKAGLSDDSMKFVAASQHSLATCQRVLAVLKHSR